MAFLLLLLVAAQLGAFSHALGHLKGGDDGKSKSPETVCEWCAAYANTVAGAPAHAALPLAAVSYAAPTLPPPVAPTRLFRHLAYLSQAPPQLS